MDSRETGEFMGINDNTMVKYNKDDKTYTVGARKFYAYFDAKEYIEKRYVRLTNFSVIDRNAAESRV